MNDSVLEQAVFHFSCSFSFFSRLEESSQLSDDSTSNAQPEADLCPTGEHVSDNVKIQRCACLVSSEEQETYDAYINGGRFVLLTFSFKCM